MLELIKDRITGLTEKERRKVYEASFVVAIEQAPQYREWMAIIQEIPQRDEIKIFLDETKESYPFWFPLHYIMIYTGMRIGEVGGLKWGDVHLEGGYIELKQALLAEYKQGKN